MKVSDLKANQAIDSLEVEITEIGEPREFSNFRGSGKVATAKAKDKTGETSVTLWNDDITKFKLGDKTELLLEDEIQ